MPVDAEHFLSGADMRESKLKRFLRHIKYRLIVKLKPRKNRVYTQFYRFPHQNQALIERVVPQYLNAASKSEQGRLEIVVFACCNGAEPYTLSYLLKSRFPLVDFRIRAFDIVPELVEQAKSSCYSRDQVFAGPFVTESFVSQAFDMTGIDRYVVKPEIASMVTFDVGDMLSKPFMDSIGNVDLLFAQNVLFHLPPVKARRAFRNLVTLLKPGSTLFINGMDTDMRIKLTKKYDLKPLEYLIEEIHNDARVDRGAGWAGAYWGREPFSRRSKDWVRKQCTIYTLE